MTKTSTYIFMLIVVIITACRYYEKLQIEKSIYQECLDEMNENGYQVITCDMQYGVRRE